MTELFAVTRTGLVDQSRDPRTGSFSLKRQCVHWFLIKPEGDGWRIRQEGLPFDEETLAWIEANDKRPTFRVKGNLALADFAVVNPSNESQTEYVRFVIGRNLLLSVAPAGLTMTHSILESVRDIETEGKPVVENILYNVVNAMIAAHAEHATSVRRFVNDLAIKVDHDTSSIDVKQFVKAKIQLDQLTYVLAEQSITLGFSPHMWWEGRSTAMRAEFANLRSSLRTLQLSMENTRARLDSIHHQYLLVLQEASNKRLNLLTIVQAIFVPLTFIAGIYGMNFVYMPALEWRYSYFVVVGLMILITMFSIRYFYKHGWFN